jgi:hypothetical protein
LDAGNTEGCRSNRPLRFTGKHVLVNVAAPQGTLRANVLDEQRPPIAPLTADNCEPARSNTTTTVTKWKYGEDLSALSGQLLRFRFHLEHGSLYAL